MSIFAYKQTLLVGGRSRFKYHLLIGLLAAPDKRRGSAILWPSVLLVEETTNLSQFTDKLYHIMITLLPFFIEMLQYDWL
jgi:hypothetical protein